jgi:hypothetical protein
MMSWYSNQHDDNRACSQPYRFGGFLHLVEVFIEKFLDEQQGGTRWSEHTARSLTYEQSKYLHGCIILLRVELIIELDIFEPLDLVARDF